ncbi:CbtB domain-containing protein [Pseudomonas oryzihabitans]|uniref:Cobalt transporter subunit CbtB n=1 Tax=Pseudomonas oryzihabitans TaxID=47885 RepID=A0AAJ2BS85_9PSED|nr:CbtB-domain containing protein [Pseudomonas psychrotolerans]MDR6236691.1 cobalt transporter subunit CbtB [Pseudomonas psychrotolerans]MDR6353902.1 cobalt transporter subunit CbtB [Pseudomonas psychrotolerans]QDD88388.1 cobalt transporter [Pseudomonas psychrotolerans]
MTVARSATTLPQTNTLAQRLTATLLAGLLGLSLVFLAGFSHIEALHNGAHDTRHSEGFPCH